MTHRHYCSTHVGYWNHSERSCPKQGKPIMCPKCEDRLMAGANNSPYDPMPIRRLGAEASSTPANSANR